MEAADDSILTGQDEVVVKLETMVRGPLTLHTSSSLKFLSSLELSDATVYEP